MVIQNLCKDKIIQPIINVFENFVSESFNRISESRVLVVGLLQEMENPFILCDTDYKLFKTLKEKDLIRIFNLITGLVYEYCRWILYYKFNNYNKRSELKKPTILLEEGNESDHIRSLKFANLNLDQTFEHWRGCVVSRTHGSNKKFFADWPQSKLPNGHDFVRFIIFLYHFLTFN